MNNEHVVNPHILVSCKMLMLCAQWNGSLACEYWIVRNVLYLLKSILLFNNIVIKHCTFFERFSILVFQWLFKLFKIFKKFFKKFNDIFFMYIILDNNKNKQESFETNPTTRYVTIPCIVWKKKTECHKLLSVRDMSVKIAVNGIRTYVRWDVLCKEVAVIFKCRTAHSTIAVLC